MTTNKELLKKYMPPQKFIDDVTAEITKENNSKPKKEQFKYKKKDFIRIATNRYWDKKKLTKTEQQEFFKMAGDAMLDELSHRPGIKIDWEERGNGYFIFDMGDNSVIHFGIKELPTWRFGVWFSYEHNKNERNHIKFHWFTQQNPFIDKFKPSRSEIQCEGKFYISAPITHLLEVNPDWDDDEYYGDFVYEIVENINFMINNPWLASYRNYRDINLNHEYVSPFYAKRYMKKRIKDHLNYEKNNKKYNEKQAKIVYESLRKFEENRGDIIAFNLIDLNEKDAEFSYYPRYKVKLCVDKKMTNEDRDVLIDECSIVIDDVQRNLAKKKKFFKYADLYIVNDIVDICDYEGEALDET